VTDVSSALLAYLGSSPLTSLSIGDLFEMYEEYFGPSDASGLVSSRVSSSVAVPGQNLVQQLTAELFDCRRRQLDAFKQGFCGLGPMRLLWAPLDRNALGILLIGEQLTMDKFLDCIHFTGFGPTSATPAVFQRAVRRLSGSELQTLLLAITHMKTLPQSASRAFITVAKLGTQTRVVYERKAEASAKLPVANTALRVLELAEYDMKDADNVLADHLRGLRGLDMT